jgi:MYXO-CTERM domain-containing protein
MPHHHWKQLLVGGALMSAGLLCMPADSFARANYLPRVPNAGAKSCGTCHVSPGGGGPRNDFGQDFDANGRAWGATLADLDSDGDSFTNGQELGADGSWMQGDAPGMYQSDPADSNSVPANVEMDMGGGEMDMGGGEMDMGGGEVDMGGGEMDMGGTPANNTTPANNNAGNNSTPGNNATPGNNTTAGNNSTPGNNATAGNNSTPGNNNTGGNNTTGGGGGDDDDDEGCAQTGMGAPAGGGFGLLAMLGLAFAWRRRR